MTFEQALEHTLGVEGGYSDHAADRGGKTMLGITEAVARENGYTGPMSAFTRDQAAEIYRNKYWNALRLNDVAAIAGAVAHEMFDTAVNMGPGRAGKFLQRALNAFSPDVALVVDGQIGTKTLLALVAFIRKRGKDGEKVLLRALNAQQGEKYLSIIEADPGQKAFAYGWFLQRVNGEFA